MIYYDFKNYEEFKQIFGIIEHGNGVKSRKNKILLALYKDKKAFGDYIRYKELQSLYNDFVLARTRIFRTDREDLRTMAHHQRWYKICACLSERLNQHATEQFNLLGCKSLPELKCVLLNRVLRSSSLLVQDEYYHCYRLKLNGRFFYSTSFETDDMDGLCEDGTLNAIRYRNVEKNRVFKMKAGKMFNHIMSCNSVTRDLPEQIQRWLSEDFVADWTEYARQNIADTEFTLHVDDNFRDIYSTDSCAGYDEDIDSFGSCMMDDDQWKFYRDAVKASAAYLTDEDGMIVARCIVFNEVSDQDGKVWRLAERQYSEGGEHTLQRQLVTSLIRGGYIDGYKCVGASCHDSRKFVDNEGNSLGDRRFSISCRLENGDTISYQDTFKNFDYESQRADNYGNGSIALDITDSEVSIDTDKYFYSEYNSEDICEDVAVFVSTRDGYFYDIQTVYAYVYCNGGYHRETCFNGDCIEIGGDYYYAGDCANSPESYGIMECPNCGNWFVETDGYYSEVTEEHYCCEECSDNAEEEWYEDNGYEKATYDDCWYISDDLVLGLEWRSGYDAGIGYRYAYRQVTIDKDTLEELFGQNLAAYVGDTLFLDHVGMDGEPVHYLGGQFDVAA